MLVLLALAAFALIALQMPLLLFGGLAILLGIFSESTQDNLIPWSIAVWQGRLAGISASEVILGLLLMSAVASWAGGSSAEQVRHWPGLPATVAVLLAATALGSAIAFHQVRAGVHVAEPSLYLVAALIVGYWLGTTFGARSCLAWLVVSSVLALPQGLYNGIVAHQLSYDDSSVIFLLGFCAILVAFRVIDLAGWRVPYLLVSGLVIFLSLRRGAWIAILVALVITGIWSRRSGFRMALAAGAVVLLSLELAHPGLAFSHVEQAASYVTGNARSREYSTHYRTYETENAWLNVKHHWLTGIGPATDWTLYNSFDLQFHPSAYSYLHNSYLWVWLRFGLLGLVAYVGFLGTSAFSLLRRRSVPLEATIIGGAVVGLAFAVATASFVTTTVRWPTTIGLMVGIGLAAIVGDDDSAATAK